MKTTRVFQLTALVLVVISVVTVGWWAIDLRGFIVDRTQDALKLHQQEATRAGAECLIVQNDRIAIDVDEPADLRLFMQRGSGTETFRMLSDIETINSRLESRE